MRHKDSNPYFQLQRGMKVLQGRIEKEAPYTMHAVNVFKETGDIIGQHTLPGFLSDEIDVQLWMPERMRELEFATQTKLAKVRAELNAISNGQEFDHALYNPKIPIEMVPNCEYVLNQNA